MRAFFMLIIKLYQWVISPFMPSSCRFLPTCSEYVHDAVKTHGVWRGGKLAVRRILRCHPWGSSGYDPVPETKRKSL